MPKHAGTRNANKEKTWLRNQIKRNVTDEKKRGRYLEMLEDPVGLLTQGMDEVRLCIDYLVKAKKPSRKALLRYLSNIKHYMGTPIGHIRHSVMFPEQ